MLLEEDEAFRRDFQSAEMTATHAFDLLTRWPELRQSCDFPIETLLGGAGAAGGGCWGAGAFERKGDSSVVLDLGGDGGLLQCGAPSETIKEDLRAGREVPTQFVLPPFLLNSAARSLSDIEFPAFFHRFVGRRRRRLRLVGDAAQLERVCAALAESAFGPSEGARDAEDAEDPNGEEDHFRDLPDVHPAAAAGQRVDFAAERRALCGSDAEATIADFVEAVAFDGGGAAALPGGVVVRRCGLAVRVDRGGACLLVHEFPLFPPRAPDRAARPGTPSGGDGFDFDCPPPTPFGVTFLGTSHGFDPHGHTTGFLLWCHGRAVLVDPPAAAPALLHARGLSAHVACAVLTHAHGDHDAGLLQLAALGRPLAVVALPSVLRAFRRKLRALTGGTRTTPAALWPVQAGRPRAYRLCGADWRFEMSFHSVPCLRFTVRCAGRQFRYSADTFFDPEALRRLQREHRPFTPERLRALIDWPTAAADDLQVHESGIPPLHTPREALEALPESVRRRLLVVHCAGLPPASSLTIPVCGLEHSLPIEPHADADANVDSYRSEEQQPTLADIAALAAAPLVASLRADAFARLLVAAELSEHAEGARLAAAAADDDGYHVVSRGSVVSAGRSGAPLRSFGLFRLIGGDGSDSGGGRWTSGSPPRVSGGSARLWRVPLSALRALLGGAAALRRLRRWAPPLLAAAAAAPTSALAALEPEQLLELAFCARSTRFVAAGEPLIPEHDVAESPELFLVCEGHVVIERGGRAQATVVAGHAVGEVAAVRRVPRTRAVRGGDGGATVLEVSAEALQWFLERYPLFEVHLQSLIWKRFF